MVVVSILYLWSHLIFVRTQWKRKYHPKFVYMQWRLPWSAIIIGSTIKIGSACMRLCTWSSDCARFLCYLCELLALFLWTIYVKNITAIYGLRPTWEVGCWTGSLTYTWGQFWPGAWLGTHPIAWHGMRVGTPTRSSQVGSGRLVLPLTIGSRGLLIYPLYIYTHTHTHITLVLAKKHGEGGLAKTKKTP
jgi:hypothetical protein